MVAMPWAKVGRVAAAKKALAAEIKAAKLDGHIDEEEQAEIDRKLHELYDVIGTRKINLKTTYIEARDWPKFRAGYARLLKWMCFIMLYFAILYIQSDITPSFEIDEALRNAIVDEGDALQEVQDFDTFFTYLEETIMPNVFPDAWYNDVPLSTANGETGFVLGYNKLVGGLLITQRRGLIKPACKEPKYAGFRSAYEDFYPTCFIEDDIANFVTPEKRQNYSKPGSRPHPTMKWSPNPSEPGWVTMVPWTLQVVKDPVTNQTKVVELEPTPPQRVNNTRTDINLAPFYASFTYTIPSNTKPPTNGLWSEATHGKKEPQESDGGFRVFLKLSDGFIYNQKKIAFLKDNLWFDKFTREVNIKFAVYNGMLSKFTYVSIQFGFSNVGTFRPFNTKGGTLVKIKSVNMEPYKVTQAHNCTKDFDSFKNGNASCYQKFANDPVKLDSCLPAPVCQKGKTLDEFQLALEVIFMIWLFNDIMHLIMSFVRAAWNGWEDKEVADADGDGEWDISPGIKTWFTNIWHWIDIMNYILFIIFIVIRVSLITMIVNKDNLVQVPTNEYVVSLEYGASINASQGLWVFCNILLCLLRTFQFFPFQPRLAVVNLTMKKAFVDLVHFILMFLTFLLGFAVVAHTLFGNEIPRYSTFLESFSSTYMLMLTGASQVAEMSNISGTMSVCFYLIFMFLVNIILLNVLLAILVDSYMNAKEDELKLWKDQGYKEMPNMIDQLFSVQAFRHFTCFASIHEALLLAALTSIKDEKEHEFECDLVQMDEEQTTISIYDIFNAIPEETRDKGVTLEMVYRHSCLQFIYDDH